MIERHYDEEALVTMLDAGARASDPHLVSCGECSGKLESFRLVTGTLRDAATWEKRELAEAPNPDTIAILRAFANAMAAEDSAADAYVADLLAGPRETWMGKLALHPEYRTPGTVRRLIAATGHALDTMPADAVEITALAADIAEHLDPATHRPDTVARLRGAAWRERAYALFYVGRFADAEKAVCISERHFSDCVVDQYERARVGIVRALVARSLENFVEAVNDAQKSAATFDAFGDELRTTSARLAEVHSMFSRGEFAAARQVLAKLHTSAVRRDDVQTQAFVFANLGFCEWKLGRPADALRHHEMAAMLFAEIGDHAAAVRSRWNTASILAGEGRIDEAMGRFQEIQREFARLGMTGSAALASLDFAELLLTTGGHFDRVEEICRTAVSTFEAAGIPHTAAALTALGLLREAAAAKSASPALARKIREHVRRLPAEPNLLFARAPE